MKISVAICTYNGEKYINEQIDSILNQTLKVDEIIVCDDGSIDNTYLILRDYELKFPYIFKIYKNKEQLKSVKNFEKAIKKCSGDIIFLSDQDDIWVNNKVEKYIEYFELNPDITVLASNGYCIDDKTKVKDKYAIWDIPEFLRKKKLNYTYFEIISYLSNIATGASFGFRKTIFNDIFPFPEINNLHHDEWIALISSSKNQFELLNEKYFYYRIHKNQQVGGIFYEKSEFAKQKKIDVYDFKSFNKSFAILKQRLKKLQQSNTKTHINQNQKSELKNLIIETRKNIKNKYPLKLMFLNFSYKLRNKKCI